MSMQRTFLAALRMVVAVAAACVAFAVPLLLEVGKPFGEEASRFLPASIGEAIAAVLALQRSHRLELAQGDLNGRHIAIEKRSQDASVVPVTEAFALVPVADLKHFLAVDESSQGVAGCGTTGEG